jgi:hypothetical protein
MRRATVERRAPRRAATVIVVALALPLSACAANTTGDPEVLAQAGCPADIRVQLDGALGVQWGFLVGLLEPEAVGIRNAGTTVTAPLVVDGVPTGSTLTILTGDPYDGVSANVDLYSDDDLLLAAVDTDAALLDAVKYPTVGLFAPMLNDPRIVYWDAEVYKGVRSIEGLGDTLTPAGDALVPIIGTAGDPFRDFMVASRTLGAEQVLPENVGGIHSFIDADGVAAQEGSALVDRYLLESPDSGFTHPYGFQYISDAGYPRDTLLAARPQSVVRYADCFEVLIPLLQRALDDYLTHPDPTTELLVNVSARLGHPEFTAELAAYGLETLVDERIVGNGRNDTIGDIDMGRLREMIEDVGPTLTESGTSVPSREPRDLATNQFIDPTVGL